MIDSVIMDGEHHPEGYNFMGKGSQNANRAGLTYTGRTGTKNYWLARDKHDRVSLEHDLLYYDDRNLIKEMSDARWLEAAKTAKIPDLARFNSVQMIKLMRELRKLGVLIRVGFEGIVAKDAIKTFLLGFK